MDLQTLNTPSPKFQKLLQEELAHPCYLGEDEDIAAADALTAIWKREGENAFDPLNPTDQILRNLAQ